ncbi:MAG: 4Fe-4S dicluster domain-containing protein [Eubacteriales bacterium]|nr:4Fe-4S dicluster domain-containing protein [Eubacteriales bacterium]
MEINELKKIIQENGVVGAGGAGFPTHAKLDEHAEIILMNCAECEPLLKLHRQLLQKHAEEILRTFHLIAETVGAKEAVIGVKKSYIDTVRALKLYIDEYPEMRIHLLEEAYPMGDEVVLIYEATKRVVRPGGIPIEQGVAVFNVETVYNISRALQQKPVTDKLVSVVAEVTDPVTVRVPIGTPLQEVVSMAGEVKVKDPVYLVGGPMMGSLGTPEQPVTKTTNAILVLPADHPIVLKKQRSAAIDLKRAASICCQCQMCTDLCPRNGLGHPIEPHLFMRAAANQDYRNIVPYSNTFFCSSCGVCEMYACPQSLAPRTQMAEFKAGLRSAGLKPPVVTAAPVKAAREFRRVPEERLTARLGLTRYDQPAPLKEEPAAVKKVIINLSQHIGAPAEPIVKVSDTVSAGQMIARPSKGLSTAVHASISGRVTAVTEKYIVIVA